jgi:hypothetical protein
VPPASTWSGLRDLEQADGPATRDGGLAAGATALAVAAVIALVPGNADLAGATRDQADQDSSLPVLPGAPVPVRGGEGVEFYETPGHGRSTAMRSVNPGNGAWSLVHRRKLRPQL